MELRLLSVLNFRIYSKTTSKLKPEAEIIGCSPYDNVLRKMQIYWGVRPLKTATESSTDKIIEHALVVSEHAGFVEEEIQ